VTATEGLAFGALILSLFLGYLSYRTSREGRTDAHELATESRRAAGEEARAARLFEARRSVYVDVMEYVYLIEDFVIRTEPLMTFEGDPGPPAFPPEEEQRRQSAAIAAFGSPAMRDRLRDFKEAGRQFQFAVWAFHDEQARLKHEYDLRRVQQRESDPEPVDNERNYREDVRQKRQAVNDLVLDIIELVNAELAR
jgi:hypothetical protein